MPRRNYVPSYRAHKASGQAVATLSDIVTGRRKDFFLGRHGTKESRVQYAQVLAGWEARGRRLDEPASSDLTVAELLVRFLTHAADYYGRERATLEELLGPRDCSRCQASTEFVIVARAA